MIMKVFDEELAALQREVSRREAYSRILARVPADTIEGLTRIIADQDKRVRFALLPFVQPKVQAEKLDKEGMIHVHVVALALRYANADATTGRYKKDDPMEWQIGYVDIDFLDWRAISRVTPDHGTMYDIDMVMAKENYVGLYDDDDCDGYDSDECDEIMTGYDFLKVSAKARWKQSPEVAAAVELAVRALLGC